MSGGLSGFLARKTTKQKQFGIVGYVEITSADSTCAYSHAQCMYAYIVNHSNQPHHTYLTPSISRILVNSLINYNYRY